MSEPQTVYVVVCLLDPEGTEHHIFSTSQKASDFSNACGDKHDHGHVLYDYVLDCPERMTQVAS